MQEKGDAWPISDIAEEPKTELRELLEIVTGLATPEASTGETDYWGADSIEGLVLLRDLKRHIKRTADRVETLQRSEASPGTLWGVTGWLADEVLHQNFKATAAMSEVVLRKLRPGDAEDARRLLHLGVRTLGIWSSAVAGRRRYGQAAAALEALLPLARRLPVEPELLRRSAYVLASKGKLDDAMKMLVEATLLLVDRNEDRTLVAEVGIERGLCWMEMGDFDRAEEAIGTGLRNLGTFSQSYELDGNRFKSLAYESLASIARHRADDEKARWYTERAEANRKARRGS